MFVSKARRVVGNPARTAVRRARAATRPRRVAHARRPANRNPHVLTLGMLATNPQRRTMAKAKRRARAVAHARRTVHRTRRAVANSRGIRRRSRKNPTRMMLVRPRRHRQARNPMFFGRSMRAGEVAKVVAGGLVGLGVTKLVVPMLPSALTTNNFAKFGSAIVVALAAGWLANKVSNDFGSAVMFGGLMEAASIGLNPYIPIGQYTGLSGARGLRAYVPAQFNEPQNPFTQAQLAAGNGGRMPTQVYRSPYAVGGRRVRLRPETTKESRRARGSTGRGCGRSGRSGRDGRRKRRCCRRAARRAARPASTTPPASSTADWRCRSLRSPLANHAAGTSLPMIVSTG